jgi:hypothetical protein
MNYKVVFDITESGYRGGSFAAFGFLFIALGVAFVAARHQIMPKWPRKAQSLFAFFFLGFAIFWTIFAFATTYADYRSSLNARLNGTATVTEGIVSDFIPMPESGHADEKFTVNGETFSYSDYVVTAGFNKTKSHGGPIDVGKQVRVTHVGNVIVKLEMEDTE